MYRFTTMRRTFPDYNGRFLGLMYGIDSAIIKYFNPSADLKDIMIMKMPYPAYYTYYMGNFIRYFVAVTLVLGLILPTLQLTKEIVYDREKKLKVRGFLGTCMFSFYQTIHFNYAFSTPSFDLLFSIHSILISTRFSFTLSDTPVKVTRDLFSILKKRIISLQYVKIATALFLNYIFKLYNIFPFCLYSFN